MEKYGKKVDELNQQLISGTADPIENEVINTNLEIYSIEQRFKKLQKCNKNNLKSCIN